MKNIVQSNCHGKAGNTWQYIAIHCNNHCTCNTFNPFLVLNLPAAMAFEAPALGQRDLKQRSTYRWERSLQLIGTMVNMNIILNHHEKERNLISSLLISSPMSTMKNTLTYEVSAQCTDFHIFHDNLHHFASKSPISGESPSASCSGHLGECFQCWRRLKNVARIFQNHTLL